MGYFILRGLQILGLILIVLQCLQETAAVNVGENKQEYETSGGTNIPNENITGTNISYESTSETTTLDETTTKVKTTTSAGPTKEPKKGFNTTDYIIIGTTSGFAGVVFIVSVVMGICRVRQEESRLRKKMEKHKQERERTDSTGMPIPDPDHRL